MRMPTLIALALIGAATVASAGSAEVSFKDSDQFADIGRSSADQRQALTTLKQHFEALARQLPASQSLRVEVTDVDLAGEPEWVHSRSDLRVLRGRADWPRIELRYTLSEAGRTVREGRESLADMNYMLGGTLPRGHEELAYERRMLERWFREKIATR